MKGLTLWNILKTQRGCFFIQGPLSYVSGTLAKRWLSLCSSKQRRQLSVFWAKECLVLSGPGLRLVLYPVEGPDPLPRGPKGYGTKAAKQYCSKRQKWLSQRSDREKTALPLALDNKQR